MKKKIKKISGIALIVLLAASMFCGSVFAAEPQTIEDLQAMLDGKDVSCAVGSIDSIICDEIFPNSPQKPYSSIADATLAVREGKVVFNVTNKTMAEYVSKVYSDLKYYDIECYDQFVGMMLQKNGDRAEKLKSELDSYMTKHLEEYEDLIHRWVDSPDAQPTPDYNPDGKNGTVVFGVSDGLMPYVGIRGGKPIGAEVEIICNFCKEYDYVFDFKMMKLDSLIPALGSETIDVAGGGFAITEERMKSVNFTIPFYNDPYVVVVKAEEEKIGFMDSLARSFRRTFIDDDRWKLFAEGLLRTVKIILVAGIPGTALGFLLFMLYRRNLKIVNGVIDVLSWLAGGLPIMTLLLILYFVVFAKSGLSADIVAELALGLVVSMAVCTALKTAVQAVGKAQIENALALGFNETQTLFNFVLPQSMKQFLPVYSSILVQLIHSTSIVGFISVMDLTKASDMVRAITFEAFFPIIFTAIVYLILDALLTFMVKRFIVLADPRHRTEEKILRRFR